MKTLLLVLLVGGCSVDASSFGGDAVAAGGRGTGGAAGAVGGSAGSTGGTAVVVRATGGVPGTTGGAGGAAGGTAGGAAGTPGITGAAGAYVPPTNCYAGRAWSGSNDGWMRPGSACNSCHTFTAAGTVFVNSNDPTNCYGVDGSAGADVQVLLVNADGTVALALKTNEAGNFWTNAAVPFPATASTVYGSGQVRMRGMVTNGDCNSCHGPEGYPGRVLPP